MSKLELREFNIHDLKKGFIETLSTFRGQINLSEKEISELMDKRSQSNIVTYVGLIDNKVIATASILYEQKLIHDGKIVAHIEDVCVHTNHRGNGYGQKLVGYLIKEALNVDNCYKIILDTKESEVHFYEKVGFKKESIVMRLNLD